MHKYLIILILLLPICVYSQRTVTLFPKENITGFDNRDRGGQQSGWYRLNDADSKTLIFLFPGKPGENAYSGSADIIVYADTSTISGVAVGDRDSLFISVRPLFYNFELLTYQESSEADKDSITVHTGGAAGLDWGAIVSDTRFLLRVAIDVPLANAIQVNFYTADEAVGGSQVDVKTYIVISKTNR